MIIECVFLEHATIDYELKIKMYRSIYEAVYLLNYTVWQ